jgi:alpha-1,6-rhamnosyltransferase
MTDKPADSAVLSDVVPPPLVSIVAPCYNAEKFLEEAINSIFAQDYPNFEVIIVDDGSSDRSVEMLEALQRTHHFTLLRQANQGVSAALNFGLQQARGKYVSTPDLDDIMLPHSVSVRVNYLEAHPEVGAVGGLIQYMDTAGNPIKDQTTTQLRRMNFDDILANARVSGAPVTLYRMDLLRQANFYDPAIKVQDFQMTLRVARQGVEIHVLPVIITRYRRHPNNLSRRYKTLLDADMRAIEPYRAHPGYEQGRAKLVNKALKYAVVEDKKDALRLLRSIPLKLWDRTTFRRVKRLMLHW